VFWVEASKKINEEKEEKTTTRREEKKLKLEPFRNAQIEHAFHVEKGVG
jgi:hypothetical protein